MQKPRRRVGKCVAFKFSSIGGGGGEKQSRLLLDPPNLGVRISEKEGEAGSAEKKALSPFHLKRLLLLLLLLWEDYFEVRTLG